LKRKDKEAREAAEELLKKLENGDEVSLEELAPQSNEVKEVKFEGRMKFSNDKNKPEAPSQRKIDIKKVLKAYISDQPQEDSKKELF